MKKIKFFPFVYHISTVTLSVVLALNVGITLSLFEKYAKSNGSYGEISLRSYFECGSGRPKGTNGPNDPGDPYVITRPRHLYNLSRLQSLGVFGENKYFQLGLIGLAGDTSGEPLCYLDDSHTTTVPFLDMSGSTYTYEPINAIGSEAVPFYSEFDGQGLEIKNLTVYADPEDAGLFGYTAHGSNVHDLFLSNVTINALGYTDTYSNLYGPASIAATGASFTYSMEQDNDTFTVSDVDKVKQLQFDASAIFNWNEETEPEPTISDPAPVIGFASTNTDYKYKILISGDFLVERPNNQVAVDLPTLYKFFKKEKVGTTGYINASSSLSLVASTTDNYGLDHSKVIMTFEFNFSLGSAESEYLIMTAHLGEQHTNNIGLIVGHCDGSVTDCYVHNGKFITNNGNAIASEAGISGVNYNSMANGSSYGLIGLIGGTVHNIAAEESDAGTSAGKDIGVLDFSTVYDEIIDENSFVGSTSFGGGVTYTPSSSMKYYDFLRRNSNNQFVTQATNTVSFNRQKIITNSDLGIFTVATDYTGTGMYDDAASSLERSVVKKDDVSINNNSYYVYYATGEYEKGKNVDFARYTESFTSDTPTEFHLGQHLPYYDSTNFKSNITSDSFEYRDRHQNYFFRFKVDGNYRTGKGFYFSDLDKKTAGGDFLSKHFENKLVDQNGNKILASADSNRSGIMLRNSLGQEIRKFSSSFATPNLSGSQKMYCIENNEYDNPAANMINFEVKTQVANVTVVAGLVDRTKAAALGIYKIDGVNRKTDGGLKYIDIAYNNPNYAFFMPTDDHLAYFDYTVDAQNKGRIGVYDPNGNFTEATGHTDATQPNAYGAGSEYGYQENKTRLYAHTFKLPQGHYCIGSATANLAKIFYVCAQGQTDGQIEFNDNAFASKDEVKNIDFTKVERYSYNAQTGVVTTNIEIGDVTTYDPNSNLLENQRCYVALTNSDRSSFDAALCNLEFVYEDNKFKLKSTTLSAIIYLSVNSYASIHGLEGLNTNTPVSLFGGPDSTEEITVYPAP